MRKLKLMEQLVLVAVAAGSLVLGAQQAQADAWQPGQPGRWVPGTPMTDCQCVTDWSGMYIGGKIGGAFSDINWTENFAEFDAPGGASFSPNSFAGGVFGGGNLQMGNWVFGLEFGFEGMGLNQSVGSPVPTDSFKTEIDWLFSIEPRIGYAWDRTMVFVKGGWVGGNATLSATGLSDNPAYAGRIATASSSDFFDGWSIGGGVEYAWMPSVIIGIDYRYTQLNLSTAASCDLCLIGLPIGEPSTLAGDANISEVMLRASYLFRPED